MLIKHKLYISEIERYLKQLCHFMLVMRKIVNSYRYLGATVNEFMEIDVTGNVLGDGASRLLGKL